MSEKKSFEYVQKDNNTYPLEKENGKFIVTVNAKENLLEVFDDLKALELAWYQLKKWHNQGTLLTEDWNIDEKGLKWISNQTSPEIRLQV